jgi:hypothetical protein
MLAAATETVTNLVNQDLRASLPTYTHRPDTVSESVGTAPEFSPSSLTAFPVVSLPTNTKPQGHPQPPVKLWDVRVD